MPSALDGGGLPFPRQQFVEPIGWISIDHALEYVAQVGVGLDVVHFTRFDQRAECCPALPTDIGTSHHPFILPMSGRSWKSITAGIPILAARSSSGA
jgi:hypothetical protein